MSKPAFTPGPWEKFEDKLGHVRVGSAEHSIALINNPLLIANVDADARLIAAAPEMLEALRGVVANINPDDWIEKVYAAIAKATGGAE